MNEFPAMASNHPFLTWLDAIATVDVTGVTFETFAKVFFDCDARLNEEKLPPGNTASDTW